MEASISVCLRIPAHITKYTTRRRKARLMLSGVVVFGDGPPLRARVAEPSLHGFTLHLERVEQQEREDRGQLSLPPQLWTLFTAGLSSERKNF